MVSHHHDGHVPCLREAGHIAPSHRGTHVPCRLASRPMTAAMVVVPPTVTAGMEGGGRTG